MYELLSRLLAVPESDRTSFRIANPQLLRALNADTLAQRSGDLAEYIARGAAELDRNHDAPWSLAHRDATASDQRRAEEVDEALIELVTVDLPDHQEALEAFSAELGIDPPPTLDDIDEVFETLTQIGDMMRYLTPAGFDPEQADLDDLHGRLAPAEKGALSRLFAGLFNGDYRRARASAQALTHGELPDPATLRTRIRSAQAARDRWRAIAPDAPVPTVWHSDKALAAIHQRLSEHLETVAECALLERVDAQPLSELTETLTALYRDRTALRRLPRFHQLRETLRDAGLRPLLRMAVRAGWGAERARAALNHAWLESVLAEVAVDDPFVEGFDANFRDAVLDEFRGADQRHIERGAERVLRRWAEGAVRARDQYPQESEVIVHQARIKSRHMPTRDLIQHAPHVLRALKPCWAMSPLVVSQLLPASVRRDGDGPAEPMFDVVIFDEASQILPADAVPALLRGRQAIVAGDPKQLPPTTFFTTLSDDPQEEEDDEDQAVVDVSLTKDFESLLDVMQALIPGGARTLQWHYRSKDERLIAFSNHHIYDGNLVTFPGALPDDCISHVEIPFSEDAITSGATNSAEVREVVDLVLDHAARRPAETLGVIAMGIKHAHRIEETLRLARETRPDLDDFFSEAGPEPFFVKNLERVQGDERDAVIISIGYGRGDGGRMRYGFGPINREGGYRRLNVAITRAKRRLTLVSTFGAEDLDPDRLRSEGPQMLREYVAYCASRGRNLGSRSRAEHELNPFEIDIKQQLESRGIPLQPQYGASGYRIDFAAMHPEQRGQPVLAIEADGAAYHSSLSARDRDRLRQAHLERLGWSFHRIWSTEWFRRPEQEVAKAVEAWERAVARADTFERAQAQTAGTPQPIIEPSPDPVEDDLPPQPPPATKPPPPRIGPRPHLHQPGTPITEYDQRQLVGLVRWIESDGLLRTEEELVNECIRALGFKRRGARIIAALEQAIAAARRELAS